MKRIGNSKEPTPARMSAVAENLRAHLNCYVGVTIDADSHSHVQKTELVYKLYISDGMRQRNFDSWPELLERYRKIMKGGLSDV